jgi:hypothetical protein
MALTPPSFRKDAVPSTRGWHHPRTGELLVSRPLSHQEVWDYLNPSQVKEAVAPAPEVLIEASPVDYNSMTKAELVQLAADNGHEVDGRLKKSELIDTVQNLLTE